MYTKTTNVCITVPDHNLPTAFCKFYLLKVHVTLPVTHLQNSRIIAMLYRRLVGERGCKMSQIITGHLLQCFGEPLSEHL